MKATIGIITEGQQQGNLRHNSLHEGSTPQDHGLPDSEARPRESFNLAWSGGINIHQGIQNVLRTFTPPMTQRKQSVEDVTQEFHNRNQQFLKQASMLKPVKLERAGSYRQESPRACRRTVRLASIGDDDWEQNYDDEDVLLIERIELDMQQVFDDSCGLSSSMRSLADGSYDLSLLDGSGCDSSRDSSTHVPQPPPQHMMNQSEFERRFDMEREERNAQRRSDMERRLSGVIGREISDRPGDKQQFIKEYMRELEKERESLILQWKSEFEKEEKRLQQENAQRETIGTKFIQPCFAAIYNALAIAEVFFSNLPLTIGAVALSWTTMGVVWFKFMEENISSCKPVHFNSPFCGFPEFPGCFDCDTNNSVYKMALYFHYACSIIGGTLAMSFLLKGILAWQVVVDELSNPTTATPVGVVCITLVCVFAGRGLVGEWIVIFVSGFHCLFAFWFLYMAIGKYKMLPDPSWSPSTVGISYAAVKTWLYFPTVGRIMLSLSMLFFFTTFFISLIRVALNRKIAAPVCWIQLSAPSITLYALTIVSQPSRSQEYKLEHSAQMQYSYHQILHEYYMPLQHFMMLLSLVGMISALHSLWSRWDKFRLVKFSPAHVAFCFPTLSHTNAVQAYRGAVDAFSTIPSGSAFKIALFSYWFLCLIIGTVVNLIFTYKFIARLPQWTNVKVAGETEPPAPADTIMSIMLPDTREFLDGPFVSPAVLQANEAGTLVRVRRGTEDYRIHGPYVRTRQVTALGFDPTLDDAELRQERAALLDWVARIPPRTRHRTLSIPMMMKLKNERGEGIYGSFQGAPDKSHKRSKTMSDTPWV